MKKQINIFECLFIVIMNILKKILNIMVTKKIYL